MYYYLASSVSRQEWTKSCTVIGYMSGQDGLSCPLGTACCILQEKTPWKPYVNKFFNGQACLVKMAEYQPCSFFYKVMDLDSVLVHKHTKKEQGQYPATLTSHLVNNPIYLIGRLTSHCHKLVSTILNGSASHGPPFCTLDLLDPTIWTPFLDVWTLTPNCEL